MIYRIVVAISLISSIVFGGEIKNIKDIKKEYSIIQNSLKLYKKKSEELNGLSTEGGKLTSYKDREGNIRLLKAELFRETGREEILYYFKESELFFVYRVNFIYNEPLYTSKFDAKEVNKSVERFYFINYNLVKFIKDKKQINNSKTLLKSRERVIKELIKILLKSK